jgi:hypothetical protein
MDKQAAHERPGTPLTLTTSKPRVSSAKGAESAASPLGDARDSNRSDEATPEPTSATGGRRRAIAIAAAVLAMAALAIGGRYYAWAAWHESTDDAFIDGHVAYGKERVRHNALVGAVDANSRSVVLARDLYVHGLGTYLAVIDAERTQYTAEDSLAQGDESLVADLIATYKALGGGWELPDDAASNLS